MNKKITTFFTVFTMAFILGGCASSDEPVETGSLTLTTTATQGFTFTVYDPNATEPTEETTPPERSVATFDDFDKFSFEEDNTCVLPGTNIRFTLPDSYTLVDDSDRFFETFGSEGDERIPLFAATDDDVGEIYVVYMGPYNFMNSSLQEEASSVIDRFDGYHHEDGGYTNVYTIPYEMNGRDCEAYGVLALYSDYPEFTQIAFLVGDHDSAYYVFCQNAVQDVAEDIIFRFEEQPEA